MFEFCVGDDDGYDRAVLTANLDLVIQQLSFLSGLTHRLAKNPAGIIDGGRVVGVLQDLHRRKRAISRQEVIVRHEVAPDRRNAQTRELFGREQEECRVNP
jgi:hypothetical protein